MSGEGGTQKTSNQPKGQSPSLRNYAIAPSPKPIKEMMITTRLAPIPEAQSTEFNSVTSLQLAYQEAKIDYSILEQKIRNTSLNQFNLLVQLNTELVAAAEKMSVAILRYYERKGKAEAAIALDAIGAIGINSFIQAQTGWLPDQYQSSRKQRQEVSRILATPQPWTRMGEERV